MISPVFIPRPMKTGLVESGFWAIRDLFVNVFVFQGSGGLVCVDAGWSTRGVQNGFDVLGLRVDDVVAVFLTHTHWDHAGGVNLFNNATLYVGEAEDLSRFSKRKTTAAREGKTVRAGGLSVRVLETPGHTPGSVCYVVNDRILSTGDTLRLNRGEIHPFPPQFNADPKQILRSIQKLARLEGLERIVTSHSGSCDAPWAAFQRWRGPR